MSRLYTLWMLIVAMVVLPMSASAVTMDSYIGKHCKVKSCVKGDELLTIAKEESRKWDIDPTWVIAIIKIESSFNKIASNRGNKGLMQVLASVHRKKISGDIYSARENLRVGTIVLGTCLKGVTGYQKTLYRIGKCFNAGPQQALYRSKLHKSFQEIRAVLKLIDFSDEEPEKVLVS